MRYSKKIKSTLSRLIKGERGQVLPLVLILLVLGSTIMAGTLTYGSTSLKTSQVTEDRAKQLCAADAGVRYAIWKLTNEWDVGDRLGDMNTGDTTSYTINENGENVIVDIYCDRNEDFSKIYKITSTASGSDSSTRVEAYVSKIFGLWENAATGGDVVDIWWGGGTEVNGPVVYPYDTSQWPFAAPGLRVTYSLQGGASTTTNLLNVFTDNTIESLNTTPAGGTLDIKNSDNNPVSATLGAAPPPPGGYSGTLYVNGDLQIGKSGSKPFSLDMQRNTIYATGDILIDPSVTLIGSGCIIAEGQIEFKPNLSLAGPDDFIFVMSLSDVSYSVQFEPNGSFYGSIAGLISIDLHPGNKITLTDPPPEGLNFPLDDGNIPAKWSIRTWQINRTTGVAAAVLSITTASPLPQGEVGIAYSKTLAAAGGTAPYGNWLVTAGSLPANLTLTPATGIISGTPTTANTFTFTVQVEDAALVTATKALTLTINSPVDIPNQLLDEGEVTMPYSDTPTANQGVPPYTPWSWTGAGSLPDGLTINSSGVISGTPTTAATYNYSIQVVDSLGGIDIQPLSITVYPKVTISTASLPNGKKNKAYGAAGGVPVAPVILAAAPGKPLYTNWLMSGNPPNLSLNPATGQLTGNLKNADVGTWNITFSVMDSLGGTATKMLTLTVNN